MKTRLLLALIGLAISFVLPTYAQQANDLVGTWTLVSITLEKDGKKTHLGVLRMDGTVGELMNRTKISHMRPAHIHFAITAPGYHGCVTHLFQKGDELLDTDVVYGVKEPLIVEFEKKPPGKSPMGGMVSTPFYEVKYDFVLQKQAAALAAAE